MRNEILRMDQVTYDSQGVAQLDNFSLSMWEGEILGLVPVNNYGVEALFSLLTQNLPLRGGYVYYREKLVNDWHSPCRGSNRVSVIRNESCLAKDLTVADNIFVLRPGFRKWRIQPRILREQLIPFIQEIGVPIRADAYIDELHRFETGRERERSASRAPQRRAGGAGAALPGGKRVSDGSQQRRGQKDRAGFMALEGHANLLKKYVSAPEFRNAGGDIRRLIHGAACHQHVGAGLDAGIPGIRGHAAVHFQFTGGVFPVNHLPDGGYLLHLIHHEGLAAEARLHSHHQDQFLLLQEGQDCLGGGLRLQHHPGPLALGVDLVNGGVDILLRIRLHVDSHQIRPGVAELLHVPHRPGDHQVHVQGQGSGGADGLHHRDADGDVGDKHAVHHIHMDVIGGGNFLNVPLQVGKVGGENGR